MLKILDEKVLKTDDEIEAQYKDGIQAARRDSSPRLHADRGRDTGDETARRLPCADPWPWQLPLCAGGGRQGWGVSLHGSAGKQPDEAAVSMLTADAIQETRQPEDFMV